MAHRNLAVFVVFSTALCACGPPVIDSSSPQKLVASVEEIRESLDPEESERFEDALGYFTDRADFTRDPETLGPVVEACAPIEGLSAQQIILAAWTTRVGIVEGRISELSARRDASETDRQVLSGFEVVESRLYPASPGFLDAAVVEMVVENHTGHRVFVASFQASLRHQDEIEPAVVEVIDRTFGVGLGPGSQASFRLETEDSAWEDATSAGRGGVFVCDVVQLVGRGKQIIASSDFGAAEAALLTALEGRLAELQAQRPSDD